MPFRQNEPKSGLRQAFLVDGGCSQPGQYGDVFRASSADAIEAMAGFRPTVNTLHAHQKMITGDEITNRIGENHLHLPASFSTRHGAMLIKQVNRIESETTKFFNRPTVMATPSGGIVEMFKIFGGFQFSPLPGQGPFQIENL